MIQNRLVSVEIQCVYVLTLSRTVYLSTIITILNVTWVFKRYDINSNSPSGGINEIVRSFSKRDSRTH